MVGIKKIVSVSRVIDHVIPVREQRGEAAYVNWDPNET